MRSTISSDQLFFYVVTVNHKSGNLLKQLIKSLNFINDLRMLIIVDHSGEIRDGDFTAKFPIQILRQDNRGYGAGLNRGLKEIPENEALVLLCNPDIRLITPRAMDKVHEYFRHNSSLAALSPLMMDGDGNMVISCRRFYDIYSVLGIRLSRLFKHQPEFVRKHYYMERRLDRNFKIDWGSGAALFCRLSTFPDRNFFDERFFLYFEDVDFGVRLKDRGLTMEFFPQFKVEHRAARRSSKDLRFAWFHLMSLIKFVSKYRGLPYSKVSGTEASDQHGNFIDYESKVDLGAD